MLVYVINIILCKIIVLYKIFLEKCVENVKATKQKSMEALIALCTYINYPIHLIWRYATASY